MTDLKKQKNKRECVQDCSEASYVVQTRYSRNDKTQETKLEVG